MKNNLPDWVEDIDLHWSPKFNNCTVLNGAPGSGKTTRALEWILSKDKDLSRLAYVSFTRKAAGVPLERLNIPAGARNKTAPYFSTLNSIAFRHQLFEPRDIVDDYNASKLVAGQEFVRRTLYEIMTGQTITFPGVYEKIKKLDSDPGEPRITHTRVLEKMIMLGVTLDVDYVVIDEAQDLTPIQWRLCEQLFANAKEVLIAGDVNQAIMGFAGAAPDILEEVEGEREYMTISHRCPVEIAEAAMRFCPDPPIDTYKSGGQVFTGNFDDQVMVQALREIPERNGFGDFRFFLNFTNKDVADTQMLLEHASIPCMVKMKAIGRNQGWESRYERNVVPGAEEFQYNASVLSTIHRVKGDETDVVVLLDPQSAFSQISHKLWYTAITRAKEQVFIGTARGELVDRLHRVSGVQPSHIRRPSLSLELARTLRADG